jgi:hypothetical protein
MRKRVVCQFLNNTEGALRFREIDNRGNFIRGDAEGAFVGDIYLRKAAIPKDAPDKIIVTVEY